MERPYGFPTYEADETQVRLDLQRLHDQTRDYLNDTLLQSVDDAIEDMEEYVREAIAGIVVGTLPDGSVTADKLSAGDGSDGQALVKDSSADGGFKWATVDVTNKQDKINATGLLKGAGSGNVAAATPGTDYAPAYTYGTTDLTPEVSDLATGTLYFVYE